MNSLERLLHHRSGLVRKGATLALRVPKRLARRGGDSDALAASPPALANSLPKSGTHLLDQIIEALPGRRNFGEFLSSMTSSFQFHRRPASATAAALRRVVPGELVRSHLFCEPEVAQAIDDSKYVHYFIYRDPRDVVLSETHYLWSLNRWHRLHRYFREAPTLDDAIAICIQGLPQHADKFYYPPIGVRFRDYAGWIGRDDVFAVKFEDLTGPRQGELIRAMAEFFASRSDATIDVDELAAKMQASVAPHRSHTYRKGGSGGWREKLSDANRALFQEHCGDVIAEYGFEPF